MGILYGCRIVELKNFRLKKIKLFSKFKVNIHIHMCAYDQLLFFYFSMIKKIHVNTILLQDLLEQLFTGQKLILDNKKKKKEKLHQGNHPVLWPHAYHPKKKYYFMSPPKHLALQKPFFFITRAVLFSRFEVGIDFPPWPFMGTKGHASNWSSR